MKGRFAAGVATQGFASATNLSLSILAGQAAGPAGLGTVFVGFAAYAAMFGLQRAFVVTPLIAATSTVPDGQRRHATSAALTLVVSSAALAAALFLVVGWMIGGSVGNGLVLFGPWLVPALLQQFWRPVFFRDGRTRRAAVNEAAWFAAILAIAPFALAAESERLVVAAWGVGSVAAAGLSWSVVRQPLISPLAAVRWWRNEASAFGSWLAVQETVFIVAGYATVGILAGVLGSSDLGGLRAAESVFAPISLVAPAILLPGLPAMARARGRSGEEALGLALRMSAAAVAFTALYLLAMVVVSEDVLGWVFGSEFSAYDFLVWPMAVTQLLATSALGFGILLQAEQRGKALLTAGVIGSLSGLLFVSVLATEFGARGAAWGFAASAALSTAATLGFVFHKKLGGR